jgi:hypothetical protein
VETRPDHDTEFPVQPPGQRAGVDGVGSDRDDAHAVLTGGRDHADATGFFEAASQAPLQRQLSSVHRRYPLSQEVLHAGREARDARRIERTGLEAVRHGRGHLPVLGLPSGPAPEQRLDVHAVADPKRAHSLGTQQALVAGESDQIGTLVGVAHGQHASGLRCVDEYDGPSAVSQRRQLAHGCAGPEHVGRRVDHQHRGAVQETVDLGGVEGALGRTGQHANLDAPLQPDAVERAQHRVVIIRRDHDGIASFQRAPQCRVERVGRVGHEREAAGIAGQAQQAAQ